MTQNQKNSQVVIKIIGELHPVMKTLRTIEACYLVSIEGKVMPNDRDSGVHVFLTVPVENNSCAGESDQEHTPTATATPLNFSMGAVSK